MCDCYFVQGYASVFSNEISSGRGYASIVGQLYPGTRSAARWSVSVGLLYTMFVWVNLPFVSVVALKTLFLIFTHCFMFFWSIVQYTCIGGLGFQLVFFMVSAK